MFFITRQRSGGLTQFCKSSDRSLLSNNRPCCSIVYCLLLGVISPTWHLLLWPLSLLSEHTAPAAVVFLHKRLVMYNGRCSSSYCSVPNRAGGWLSRSVANHCTTITYTNYSSNSFHWRHVMTWCSSKMEMQAWLAEKTRARSRRRTKRSWWAEARCWKS